MIEIDEPPDIAACASCARPIRWFWGPGRSEKPEWTAFVPDSDRLPVLHTCRRLQAPHTWRQLSLVPQPDQADRNAAGRAQVEEAIKNKERTEEPSGESE